MCYYALYWLSWVCAGEARDVIGASSLAEIQIATFPWDMARDIVAV